ncbi:hypothetical protein HUU61_10230, partial [Rhodopseudomonas palustris]|nr:hypothetical protein [Rhodopseudomonas palustris]
MIIARALLMVSGADRTIFQTCRVGGLAAALLFSTALTSPLLAAGGASQTPSGNVAPGGDDSALGPGAAGGDGDLYGSGGGGGGAGKDGGQGGQGNDGVTLGGAGGTSSSRDGGDGYTDASGYGSGGGGGAHGYYANWTYLPQSSVTGGSGGAGGMANTAGAGGGGGGAGGNGAAVEIWSTNLSSWLPLNAVVAGGNGGAGGDGSNGARGGNGGSGGTGLGLIDTILFWQNQPILSIAGTVTGGNGGAGGANGGSGGNGGAGITVSHYSGAPPRTSFDVSGTVTGGNGGAAGSNGGVAGLGGAGMEGKDLGITMLAGGSIAGGMNSDGITRGHAVNFTSGDNYLTFTGATSQLSGNINLGTNARLWLYGASALPGGTVIDNTITGGGTIIKDWRDTITFSAANTYSGETILRDGVLKLSGAGTLGDASNTTTISGGTLDLGTTTQTQSRVNLYSGMLQNG